MPTLDTYQGVYLWRYVPSLPASIIAAILFGIATIAHCWKVYTANMWFCLPFVIGGLRASSPEAGVYLVSVTNISLPVEFIGYVARAAAYDATGNLTLYLIQGLFLILPPVLFAASLYMVYSRVVRAVGGERFSPTPLRWTTLGFVLGDFACLDIQGAGSGLLAKPGSGLSGTYIIVSGLIMQVLLCICFMVLCRIFNNRFKTHLTKTGATTNVPWQSRLNMLYSTSLAILVRNIYRVVEFTMGQDSYVFNTEWLTYLLDGVLMLLVMIGFFIWHPSQLRPRFTESVANSVTEPSNNGISSAEHEGVLLDRLGPEVTSSR